MFFFPLFDENATSRRPVVVWMIIAACIFAFFWQQSLDVIAAEVAVYQFGFVPAIVFQDETLPAQFIIVPSWATFITSMFLHGGWLHLGGNMLYLWIFGDNVEDDMGHARYLIYYLAAGVLASLAFVFLNARGDEALTPCLGASGAISGVLGGYLVLHPNRRVSVILFRFIMDVPGYVAVGIYFLMQVVLGLSDTGGGVAYSAHVAGFIAGLILAKPLSDRDIRRQADQLVTFRRRHKGR